VTDLTEGEVIQLRRKIFLTIQSSMEFEEAAHKLMQLRLAPGLEREVVNMIVESCAQARTFQRFYGLLAQRFCVVGSEYQQSCVDAFGDQYESCHRLETRQLRNIAKLFAFLLHTDAIPWTTLEAITVTEEATNPSKRIFLKVVFQELFTSMGRATLQGRLADPSMREPFRGLFPKDHPR